MPRALRRRRLRDGRAPRRSRRGAASRSSRTTRTASSAPIAGASSARFGALRDARASTRPRTSPAARAARSSSTTSATPSAPRSCARRAPNRSPLLRAARSTSTRGSTSARASCPSRPVGRVPLRAARGARARSNGARREIWTTLRDASSDRLGRRERRAPAGRARALRAGLPHVLHADAEPGRARAPARRICASRGILGVFHYQPLHRSPMGERFGAQPGDCPVAGGRERADRAAAVLRRAHARGAGCRSAAPSSRCVADRDPVPSGPRAAGPARSRRGRDVRRHRVAAFAGPQDPVYMSIAGWAGFVVLLFWWLWEDCGIRDGMRRLGRLLLLTTIAFGVLYLHYRRSQIVDAGVEVDATYTYMGLGWFVRLMTPLTFAGQTVSFPQMPHAAPRARARVRARGSTASAPSGSTSEHLLRDRVPAGASGGDRSCRGVLATKAGCVVLAAAVFSNRLTVLLCNLTGYAIPSVAIGIMFLVPRALAAELRADGAVDRRAADALRHASLPGLLLRAALGRAVGGGGLAAVVAGWRRSSPRTCRSCVIPGDGGRVRDAAPGAAPHAAQGRHRAEPHARGAARQVRHASGRHRGPVPWPVRAGLLSTARGLVAPARHRAARRARPHRSWRPTGS